MTHSVVSKTLGGACPPRVFDTTEWVIPTSSWIPIALITQGILQSRCAGLPREKKSARRPPTRKNIKKNKVCLKRCGRSWRFVLSNFRQNRSYPRVLLAMSKFTFKVLWNLSVVYTGLHKNKIDTLMYACEGRRRVSRTQTNTIWDAFANMLDPHAVLDPKSKWFRWVRPYSRWENAGGT